MDEAVHLHKCLNDCSGRGTCRHNFCHCRDGSWGADCSLGVPGSAAPSLLRAASAAAGSGAAEADGVRPRIYVYDMPPRFTSWLADYSPPS